MSQVVHKPLTVDALMSATFDRPRDPRSAEYKSGVKAALEFRINGVPIKCLYEPTWPHSDAFYAGVDEGHAIWRSATEA